jgi:hypothetical protein
VKFTCWLENSRLESSAILSEEIKYFRQGYPVAGKKILAICIR